MTDHADELRTLAQDRRNRGQPTGKSAKGWNVNPSARMPLEGFERVRSAALASLRDHWAAVLADYQWAAHGEEIPW